MPRPSSQPASDAASAAGHAPDVPELASLDDDALLELLGEARERMLALPSAALPHLSLELEESVRVTAKGTTPQRRLVLSGPVPMAQRAAVDGLVGWLMGRVCGNVHLALEAEGEEA